MSSAVVSSGRFTVFERAREERLGRCHHLQVALRRDRTLTDRHVEHRQVLFTQAGSTDDRSVLAQVRPRSASISWSA
jgi:uncharacterized membrane protein